MIVLRTGKGSALTYEELDRNQSQFYYSSSLHSDGTILRLHFTGSSALDLPGEVYTPRYDEIVISSGDVTISGSAFVAGSDREIQFNDNGDFGASPLLTFKKVNGLLGIGTSDAQSRVDIQGDNTNGGIVSLRSFTTGTNKYAYTEFFEGTTSLGKIGKIVSAEQDIYLTANSSNRIKFEVGTTGLAASQIATINATGLAVGVQNNTTFNQKITTVSTTSGIGVASTTNFTDTQNKIRPLTTALVSNISAGKTRLIPDQSNPAGLLIESPSGVEGGNIVVSINTDGNEKEGFNIIKADEGDYSSTVTNGVIASFQASGKIGFNTNFPSVVGLTVAGEISGSGNTKLEGTLTVETVDNGSADTTSALVITSTGLIQQIPNTTPIPLGGIIMWSGAIIDIPTGWNLCDGTNGTPNLQDKFIVGAGDTYAVSNQGGSANAVVVSHTHTATSTDSGHTHGFQYPVSVADSGGGDDNRLSITDNISSVDITATTSGTANITTTVNSTGVSGTNANLPPYFALAYIMYIG